MTPLLFLAITLCITAGAATWRRSRLLDHRRTLQTLARQWGMHYSPHDRFGLADGIVSRLPVVGASDVRVIDLIYGNESDAYRYLLCVEFTTGVTYSKHCEARVLTFREGKSTGAGDKALVCTDVAFADHRLPRIEQYQTLHASNIKGEDATPTLAGSTGGT